MYAACILLKFECDMTGVKANNGPESKDCPYFYKFGLGSAGKSSKYSPCTNRPVACTLCNGSAIWSYNMKYHYETVHKNSTLPSEFIIPDSEIKNVKKKILNVFFLSSDNFFI